MSHLERGDEPNDQLIHFRRSDGDPTARPPADKLNGPSNPGGFVDYMKKVGVNEAPAKLWRQKLGNALRKDLGLSMNKQYYLAGWPRDYELFVHYKGESKAGTLPRNDLYLYGGPSKFRSANEFYPHARWLLRSRDDETPCSCKYCGDEKSQRVINYESGLGPPVPEQSSRKVSRKASSNIHVSKVMHPFRQQLPSATTPEDYSVPSVNQDRDSDLRSLRHFRSGEMVWCRIEPPLPLGADEIGWWPAVIQDYRIDHHKQSATPHSNWYRIRLFGVTAHYLRQEESLLPWLSYRPPPTLQRMVRDTPRVGMKEAFSFHPMPDPLNVSWNDAEEDSDNSRSSRTTSAKHDIGQISTTYFLALFVASKIVRYWTATDRWVFEGKVEEGQEPFEEVRFQGIWWGSERLWAGDMVRIRPPLKELIDEDLLQPSAMAETRGVFVRINSFYLEDEVTHEGSSEQRPMFAGAIFELAEAESSDISFGPRETSPIYPFPTPPTGFKWRMITPSIYHEAHFYLTEIAGRYYPGLVPSRRLAPMLNANTLRDYLRSPNPGDFTGPLLALGGFIPGRSNYLDPKQWKPNRTAMLKSAYEAGVRKVFPDQEIGDLGDDFMVELKEDDEKEDSLSEEESDGEEHTEDAGVEDDVEKLSISTVKSD